MDDSTSSVNNDPVTQAVRACFSSDLELEALTMNTLINKAKAEIRIEEKRLASSSGCQDIFDMFFGHDAKEKMEKSRNEKDKELKNNIGFVYVVRVHGFYKIGRSMDFTARLSSLQGGCPYPLGVVMAIKVKGMNDLEKRLHQKYKKYHHQGEWFKFPRRQLQKVCNEIFKSSLPKREPPSL